MWISWLLCWTGELAPRHDQRPSQSGSRCQSAQWWRRVGPGCGHYLLLPCGELPLQHCWEIHEEDSCLWGGWWMFCLCITTSATRLMSVDTDACLSLCNLQSKIFNNGHFLHTFQPKQTAGTVIRSIKTFYLDLHLNVCAQVSFKCGRFIVPIRFSSLPPDGTASLA